MQRVFLSFHVTWTEPVQFFLMWNEINLDKFVLYGIVQKKHFENDVAWLFKFLGKNFLFWKKLL